MTISEERKPLAYSLGIHLFIVLVAIIRPYFSAEIKPFKSSIRVDIVALPDKVQKIIKEKKKKIKVKKKKSKVKPKKKAKPVVLSKSVSKKISARKEDTAELEEDAFAKLARIREEQNIEEEKQKQIAGNRAAKGTDLTGVEKIEYSNYRSTLHRAISEEWNVPKWLLEGDLSAVVHIKIDEMGSLIYKKITRSSGNSIYDEKVMEAIEDSAPFSPPPEKFKKIVYYEGVELSFPR